MDNANTITLPGGVMGSGHRGGKNLPQGAAETREDIVAYQITVS